MEDISPEKRRQYLSVVLEESDRMAKLTNDLLEASQLESRPMVRAPVDMDHLIKQVLSYFAVPARQKGVNISSDIQDITLIRPSCFPVGKCPWTVSGTEGIWRNSS